MRRILIALCALTLISGCGGGVDASLIATAVKNTEAAGGAEVAFQATMKGPAGESFVMTGSGVEDAAGRQAQLSFTVPGAGEMEVVADELTMYVRSGLLTQAVGKEWLKIDLARTLDELGIDAGSFTQFGQGASEQLRLLKAVSDGVSEEGTDTVAGVEATHYSATIDLRRYADLVPEAERELAQRGIARLIDLSGQGEIPIDVWIDGEQRVRRMEWEQTFSGDEAEVSGKLVAEYVRFGVPVDIDVPSDAEVFDATQLGIQGL
jgi:hypothetical protein